MGQCCSGGGAAEERFQNRVKRARPILGKLKVPEEDARRLYRVFEKADRDTSGDIDIDEFFKAFNINHSYFAVRVFEQTDVNGDHEIDFPEFFSGLYNFCTMSERGMMRFAFELFDTDRSGSIEKDEVRNLVKMMYGKKKLDQKTIEILSLMDKDKSGSVSLSEFYAMQKHGASLMLPAFTLQRELRQNTLGERWWKHATKARQEAVELTLIFSMSFAH